MVGIADKIVGRISEQKPGWVCTPTDFIDLGSRAAVDQALARLVKKGTLRRAARGLYHMSRKSKILPGHLSADPYSAAEAIARRDNSRMLPDSLDSANLLGLTNAVAAKIVYDTDGYSRTLTVDGMKIRFRHAPPSVMRWAGRPGARVVQALRWLGPHASKDPDVIPILKRVLPDYVKLDLSRDLHYLPVWMQPIVSEATNNKVSES